MGILSGINQKRLFRTILTNNRERLYRMAFSWTHDPALADDLVQQTCYQALRKQRHLRDIDAELAAVGPGEHQGGREPSCPACNACNSGRSGCPATPTDRRPSRW